MAFKSKKPTEGRMLGELKVLQKLSPYEFGVELWVMREGRNNNKWDYRNLEKYYQTFRGTPILIAYIGNQIGDGHNMTQRRDPKTGEPYLSFTDSTAERIVGTLSDDINDLSLRERDGYKWLVAKGRLFSFYAPELVEKIVRTGRMEVSAETEVFEMEQNGDEEIFTVWAGLGVTILGDNVAPAIPGARIAALAAMQDEFKSLKLRAASLNPGNKPQNKKDTSKGVKTLNVFSKKRVAELAKRFEGYTGLAAAQSETGIHVCLMANDGTLAVYTMETADETIVPEKVIRVDAKAVCDFGDNGSVEVEVGDITDNLNALLLKANTARENAEKELEKAQDTIKAMQESEARRRLQAAKDTAKNTLAEFNANREDKVEEDVIKAVNEAIDRGDYTGCETENGDWCGDEAVKNAVLAACATAVMAMDKKAVESKKTVNAWSKVKDNNNTDDGTIEGMLSRWGLSE